MHHHSFCSRHNEQNVQIWSWTSRSDLIKNRSSACASGELFPNPHSLTCRRLSRCTSTCRTFPRISLTLVSRRTFGNQSPLIPAPNLGVGIPLPIFQFWCGDLIPLPNFLKLNLVRGVHQKLVRFPARPADPDSSVFAELLPAPQPEPSQLNVPTAKTKKMHLN